MILTPYNYSHFWEDLYTAPLTFNQDSQFHIVNSDNLTLENVSEERMIEYVESGELDELQNYWEHQQNSELILGEN
jgi:hypothetical protein